MNTHTWATIRAIYRYPVKGLSAEPLAATALTPGETVSGDRRYAIENGPSGFDPAMPRYLPKQRFLMLMKNERLARLDTHFDDASHVLVIQENGTEVARGDLRTPAGRAGIEGFFLNFCADELRGPPKLLAAQGHSFSDVAKKVVSIINLASLVAIEGMVGIRSILCAFAATSMWRAGPPGANSIFSARKSQSERMRVQGSSSASHAVPPPMWNPVLACATSTFRRPCSAILGMPTAASTPR
jgi:MOSC N-terminal beta barrel domain